MQSCTTRQAEVVHRVMESGMGLGSTMVLLSQWRRRGALGPISSPSWIVAEVLGVVDLWVWDVEGGDREGARESQCHGARRHRHGLRGRAGSHAGRGAVAEPPVGVGKGADLTPPS